MVFTGGALEEECKLGSPATVGGVFDLSAPGCASVFGSQVPCSLLQRWDVQRRGSRHWAVQLDLPTCRLLA